MARDPRSLATVEAVRRELLINRMLTAGLTALVFLGFVAVVASRGRLLMPPLGLLFILGGGVGTVAGYASLSSEARGLKAEIARRSVPPAPKPEELKLASIQKSLQALPEAADPETVALLRLTAEVAEELVAIIRRHRSQGTEEAIEPTRAMAELVRLESEARTGSQQASEGAPADALTRAAQIKFERQRGELA